MNFNSFSFLFFYPIVLLLFFRLPHKFRWGMLLIASYYFYMSWNPELIFLILFTTAVSYYSAIIMEKTEKKSTKKLWLIITLVTSLGILFFFKYFNFLSSSVTNAITAFGIPTQSFTLKLILPVGISFYTFQTLSYVIDVYRGNIPAEHHFGYYALFVSFFPQLVAGPIERPENLLPQLKSEHTYNSTEAAIGAKRMLAGFFKKIVVADLLAPYVNTVFNHPTNVSGISIAIAAMLFAIQIYCDFSGYTDIAIGCARVMGIHLMQNFNNPYTAENIRDFWARWHISLTSWFKDYLYIPLGGNRCSKFRHYTNIMIVFLVSGLWHGANWTFALWGFLHGFYQVIGNLTVNIRMDFYRRMKINTDSHFAHLFRRTITFLLVCFAWIFFRANNPHDLYILLNSLFLHFGNAHSAVSDMKITLVGACIAFVSILIMTILDNRFTCCSEPQNGTGAKLVGGTAIIMIWAVVVAWMFLLSSGTASSFIYFQF